MADNEQEVLEDGGIEVEIASTETPESKPDAAAPAEVKVESEPQPSQAAVDELRTQLKAMENREAAALRERQHLERVAREQAAELARAQEEAVRARGEMVDVRRTTLDSSIVAAQAEADLARRDYQTALEVGDFTKAAEANWRLNKAAAQAALLEEKKQTFATEQPRPHEGSVRQPQRNADPVESYIENKSPRTQSWLRAHPETITDPRMNNKTVAAHYDALAEGYAVDTEGYFNYIDRKLGFAGQVNEPAETLAQEPPEQPRQRQRAAPPAAPVSRDPPRSEKNTGRMYLTKGEQEVAEALGITPSEYARRKQAMEKQGYYHS